MMRFYTSTFISFNSTKGKDPGCKKVIALMQKSLKLTMPDTERMQKKRRYEWIMSIKRTG
jgi:hypothetical protein